MGYQQGPDPSIHDPAFVRSLFDEMSDTYGMMNVASSFGFCILWRHRCGAALKLRRPGTVVDLMSGMGELWPSLFRGSCRPERVIGVDFSPGMCAKARRLSAGLSKIEVREEDALASSLPDACADGVISSFGLKTFTPAERGQLAREVARLLKPGGRFAFVEISTPRFAPLRWAFHGYLGHIIPVVGRLFMGNPDNYRMLGRYTAEFGSCRAFRNQCEAAGLEAEFTSYFFGCATGVAGAKPLLESAPAWPRGSGASLRARA